MIGVCSIVVSVDQNNRSNRSWWCIHEFQIIAQLLTEAPAFYLNTSLCALFVWHSNMFSLYTSIVCWIKLSLRDLDFWIWKSQNQPKSLQFIQQTMDRALRRKGFDGDPDSPAAAKPWVCWWDTFIYTWQIQNDCWICITRRVIISGGTQPTNLIHTSSRNCISNPRTRFMLDTY